MFMYKHFTFWRHVAAFLHVYDTFTQVEWQGYHDLPPPHMNDNHPSIPWWSA